ncbi:hypothetical protein [Paenibacillus sambharensis]|uniref:hypothetical protein n=1 Tax=Paenibacillus sambharensis TaxID=1803190 RepID=UPI0011B7C83D|nr:hypothetical protein [Paenibacillus sambharensis]
MKLMLYQFKIVYSPIKWLLCAAFIVMIPFLFYAPTGRDVLNLYEIYACFVGIILLPDVFWVDHYAHATEMLATRRTRGSWMLWYRWLWFMLFSITMLFVGWLLLRLDLSPHGYLFSDSSLSYFTLLYVTMPGLLFSGALSLLGGAVFRSPEVGYVAGIAHWMYWNVNMEIDSWFNLFSYANQLSHVPSKWTLLMSSIILVAMVQRFMLRPVESLMLFARLKKRLVKGLD